jgi:putative urate catabolism protein
VDECYSTEHAATDEVLRALRGIEMTEPLSYLRDFQGYGRNPPPARWPNGARLALQFVLNYEEGGESSVLNGDPASESFLSEIVNAVPRLGQRHISMESIYEYGSRVGVWRLLDLFYRKNIPITIFAVAMALERNPAVADAALEAGHEICSHGYRWIDYHDVLLDIEREHLYKAIEIIKRLTGERPLGWYTGRTSVNTRRLVVEEGGFLYDADDYSDDLPHWIQVKDKKHLVVPYTLDANDMRFVTPQGFNSGEQFYTYLRDSFDVLYKESADTPRMMSVGLHCRLIGRPGRILALERFIDYIQKLDRVWLCRRIDIARHWYGHHSPF